MQYAERKNHRLSQDTYRQSGAYFVTICTHEKRCVFSKIWQSENEQVIHHELTPYGQCVESAIALISQQFDEVTVAESIIMPNHVHLILFIRESSKTPTISGVIRFFKIRVTQGIRKIDPEAAVWQRDFYDHIIRNEQDYVVRAEYIRTNPLRWVLKKDEPSP